MSENLRILFAGGGTGGHLYPGLALGEEFAAQASGVEMRFLATRRPIDRYVLERTRYGVEYVESRGFSMRPWRWPMFVLALMGSGAHARRTLAEFRPHAVIGLGGFGSYGAVRAGQRQGVPTFLVNPDIVAGRANCRLARRATVMYCQFGETVREVRCGGRIEVVGCPIRRSLFGVARSQACEALDLDESKKTLVVTGASSGSRSINQAMVLVAPRLKQFADWQVLHLTGRSQYEEMGRALGRQAGYRLVDYEERMGLVYAAADVVIARAGAVTVAELTALGLPSVLMPYPFHRDRHQERHARALESAGAAVMVRDAGGAHMNADGLWRVLPQLLEDAGRRRGMAEAARSLGKPKASANIAKSVLESLGRRPEGGRRVAGVD